MTTTLDPPAIEVAQLRKTFGERTVLDSIDLTVPRGSVLALLGPNGAGKTTTVNILSTLIRPDGGTARVAGHDVTTEPAAVRAAIGVTGQFSAVDGLLSARENLHLMADLNHLNRLEGRRRAVELLELFDLTAPADTVASTFSGGMRRRLDLAMTLVGKPGVVFLDEPTSGLDPRSRRGLWEIVRGLVAGGVTILLTTQYVDEADELADTVAVLDDGRIVAHGTPAELKRLVPGGTIRLAFADADSLQAASTAFPDGVHDDAALTLTIPGAADLHALRTVIERLDRAGVTAADLEVTTPGLDDVFLALTGPNSRKASS